MTGHTVQSIVCPACTAGLDLRDQFCRHCGMPTSLRSARGEQLAIGAENRRDPLDSPWVVLGLLLFVLGPFALPFLYKSRAFSMPMKIFLTVVVMVIAVIAVWVTLYLIGRIVAPIQEAWPELMQGLP